MLYFLDIFLYIYMCVCEWERVGPCAGRVKPIWVYVSAVVISLPVAGARWSCLCKPLSKYITDPGMWANRSTTSYLNSPSLSLSGFLCSLISLSMHSIYHCDTDTLAHIRESICNPRWKHITLTVSTTLISHHFLFYSVQWCTEVWDHTENLILIWK